MNPYDPPQTESPKEPWYPSDDVLQGMVIGIVVMAVIMQIVVIAGNLLGWLLWRY